MYGVHRYSSRRLASRGIGILTDKGIERERAGKRIPKGIVSSRSVWWFIFVGLPIMPAPLETQLGICFDGVNQWKHYEEHR